MGICHGEARQHHEHDPRGNLDTQGDVEERRGEQGRERATLDEPRPPGVGSANPAERSCVGLKKGGFGRLFFLTKTNSVIRISLYGETHVADPKALNELERAQAAIAECKRLRDWWKGLWGQQRDEFFVEMRRIYLSKANPIGPLLDYIASRGVRFVSISECDLVIFEDIQCNNWPIAWDIARRVGIDMGCGNGPQAQISLYGFLLEPAEHVGIYDLRERPFVRIHETPLSLSTMRRDAIEKRHKGGSLDDYIKGCFS